MIRRPDVVVYAYWDSVTVLEENAVRLAVQHLDFSNPKEGDMRSYHCFTCRTRLYTASEAAQHELQGHNTASFPEPVVRSKGSIVSLWEIVRAFCTKKRHALPTSVQGGRK